MKTLFILYKQVVDDDKRDLHWECQGAYVDKVSAMQAGVDLIQNLAGTVCLTWIEDTTKQGLNMWIGFDRNHKVVASIVERV